MARMFGFIGNRPDLGARVLELTDDFRRIETNENEPVGWGVGFYQSGEVLLRRRPIDEREHIDLAEVTESVRTDVLLGHVRHATVGSLRTENTHPFRYRQWLFASTGTVQHFESLRDRLLESQPDFLRRNVRGDTDSELFFYMFLSFLHDAGHVHADHVEAEHIRRALKATISLVDRLSAEEGAEEPNTGDVIVTNGEQIVAVHRDGIMGYRVLKGRHDVEELLGVEGMRQARIPNVDTTRCAVIASGLSSLPERWTDIDARAIVTLTRNDDPMEEPL